MFAFAIADKSTFIQLVFKYFFKRKSLKIQILDSPSEQKIVAFLRTPQVNYPYRIKMPV